MLISYGAAAFVSIDKAEHGFDLGTTCHAGLFLPTLQRLGDLIVPAALPHELVPNVSFVLGRLATVSETPVQNFLIGAPLLHAFGKRVVVHSQKSDAQFIE